MSLHPRNVATLFYSIIFLSHIFSSFLIKVQSAPLTPISQTIKQQPKQLPFFHPLKIREFLTYAKTSSFEPSIWSYHGQLVDPLSNTVLALVEGIELIRPLSECFPSGGNDCIDEDDNNEQENNSNTIKAKMWRTFRGFRRLGDLNIRNLLQENQNDWQYAGTVLSRKLFCYKPVDSNNGASTKQHTRYHGSSNDVIQNYKINPTSPTRIIPFEQSVVVYDTAVTYISSKNGEEMIVHTEWPDGRWVQGIAQKPNDLSSLSNMIENEYNKDTKNGIKYQGSLDMPFEFTTYIKRRGKNEKPILPSTHITKIVTNTNTSNESSSHSNDKSDKESSKFSRWMMKRRKPSIMVSPPRSKFIQFGKDENAENRRFGARETYSFQYKKPQSHKRNYRQELRSFMINSISDISERIGLWDLFDDDIYENKGADDSRGSCTVKYTRYGEAPPWYGPGRMCTLELWGRRVNSVLETPALAARIAATNVPGFMSVNTPIPSLNYDTMNQNKKRKYKKTHRRNSEDYDENIRQSELDYDNAAIQAVNWFRGTDGALPLTLVVDEKPREEGILPSIRYFIQDLSGKGLMTLERLRSATTFSTI